MPPLKIQLELMVEADWVVVFPEAAEWVDHAAHEGSTKPCHSGSVVKMSNQRLQLMPVATAPSPRTEKD